MKEVLVSMSAWFGNPSAVKEYVALADRTPTWLLWKGEQLAGACTVKTHFPISTEILCLGILPKFHGRGGGRMLLSEIEKERSAAGVRWLKVKTLSAAHPSREYAHTRQFYAAVGYESLEEFPTLWGEWLPCLQLCKAKST